MSRKMAGWLNITIAVVFAILILVTSVWMKETPYADSIMFWLIACWWIPFSFLSGSQCCGRCWFSRSADSTSSSEF